MLKFAAFQVQSAVLIPKGSSPAQLRALAVRHEFKYTPRPGYLYVRSRAISSRTNDNYDEFPAEEIAKGYKTFIGKPCFVNHVNDNHRRARGVIIDAVLHRDTLADGSPDTWVEVLHEVDAINFPKLAKAILAGRIDRTSMGCDVEYSICSMCGNKATTPAEYCAHIPRLKGKKVLKRNAATGSQEEHLIRETCYGLKFFENSLLVEPPADPTAVFTGVDDHSGLGKAASKQVIADYQGWVYAPQHPGVRLVHTPGHPIMGPRKTLDVGDQLLSDDGQVHKIIATTPRMLRLDTRSAPVHRAPIEGDYSGVIMASDAVDEAGKDVPKITDEQKAYLDSNGTGPTKYSSKTAGTVNDRESGENSDEYRRFREEQANHPSNHLHLDDGTGNCVNCGYSFEDHPHRAEVPAIGRPNCIICGRGTHSSLHDEGKVQHLEQQSRRSPAEPTTTTHLFEQFGKPYYSDAEQGLADQLKDIEGSEALDHQTGKPTKYSSLIQAFRVMASPAPGEVRPPSGDPQDADGWTTCGQGHRHWGLAGAAGLLIRHQGDGGQVHYLLQHRAPWVDDGDTWGIPAGALKHNESPIQGAHRESVEELGGVPHGLRHVTTHTDDHGNGWAFHTVVMESPSMWGSSGGADAAHEVGEGGTGWYTAEQMKSMKLHPGFAKTWNSTLSKMASAEEPEQPEVINLGPVPEEFKAWMRARDADTHAMREMNDHVHSRTVDLSDPTDLRQHMIEAHGYGDDDFWRNSHAEDHPALGPARGDDRPLNHREIRRLHDWEHGNGVRNDNPDYEGGLPGQFMGDSHFHTARRTASTPFAVDKTRDPKDRHKGRETDSCRDCGSDIYRVQDHWQHDIDTGAGVPHQAVPVSGEIKVQKSATWVGDHPDEPTLFWRAPKTKRYEVHIENYMPDRNFRENYGVKPRQEVRVKDHEQSGYGHVIKDHADAEDWPRSHPWGGLDFKPPRHVLNQVHNALDEVEKHAQNHADLYGQMAEQQDIESDMRRVPHDMAAEQKAHQMFRNLLRSAGEKDCHTCGGDGHLDSGQKCWNCGGSGFLQKEAAAGDTTAKGLTRLDVPAEEVQAGDYLDIGGKTRVHATNARESGVTLAYRVRGSKAPGVRIHQPGEIVNVWRRTATRKQAAMVGEGDAIWAKPAGEYPHREWTEEHGSVDPADGPFHLTRHPETRAHQLVDRQNRLIASSTGSDGSYHEYHPDDWLADSFHELNQAGGHHSPLQHKDTHFLPEPQRSGVGEELNARERGHGQYAPAFEHSTRDPRQDEFESRPAPRQGYPAKSVMESSSREHGSTYRTVQHGEPGYDEANIHASSPSEEWHGPYEVIQHPDTGKYHVVDNQNRVAGGDWSKRGYDTQTTAESARDDVDRRTQGKERAKSMVDKLWSGVHDIVDPGGTEESRRSEKHMQSMSDLMSRYEGGPQHPLTPGRFGYDDAEKKGDQNGEPYYEVKDPGGSGYTARDYGGGHIDIHHEGLPDYASQVDRVHPEGSTEGGWSGPGTKRPGYGHEDMHEDLQHWIHGDPDDEESYAAGKDYARATPEIERWQKRKGYKG